MPVTDSQYMVVRTLLAGDLEKHRFLYEEFDLDSDPAGYAALVDATASQLDPEVAERLITAVFTGGESPESESDEALAVKTALLGALTADKPLDDADLGVFMVNARSRADQQIG